jgi:hypothetical protein
MRTPKARLFFTLSYPAPHITSCRRFSADDLKLLRVAMSSFFDMLLVCTKTLMEFDDDPAVQG